MDCSRRAVSRMVPRGRSSAQAGRTPSSRSRTSYPRVAGGECQCRAPFARRGAAIPNALSVCHPPVTSHGFGYQSTMSPSRPWTGHLAPITPSGRHPGREGRVSRELFSGRTRFLAGAMIPRHDACPFALLRERRRLGMTISGGRVSVTCRRMIQGTRLVDPAGPMTVGRDPGHPRDPVGEDDVERGRRDRRNSRSFPDHDAHDVPRSGRIIRTARRPSPPASPSRPSPAWGWPWR